jgi:hypothetical protein
MTLRIGAATDGALRIVVYNKKKNNNNCCTALLRPDCWWPPNLWLAEACAIPQIPGGWAAQRYGGRIMLILCFVLWSTVSLLTPTDASYVVRVIIARVCVGVSQGFLIPAVHTVLSQVRVR